MDSKRPVAMLMFKNTFASRHPVCASTDFWCEKYHSWLLVPMRWSGFRGPDGVPGSRSRLSMGVATVVLSADRTTNSVRAWNHIFHTCRDHSRRSDRG